MANDPPQAILMTDGPLARRIERGAPFIPIGGLEPRPTLHRADRSRSSRLQAGGESVVTWSATSVARGMLLWSQLALPSKRLTCIRQSRLRSAFELQRNLAARSSGPSLALSFRAWPRAAPRRVDSEEYA